MTDVADALPDDPAVLKAMVIAERAESERLRQILKEFQRHRFGPRSESLSEDQLQLALEDTEQVTAAAQADSEEKAPAERKVRAARRRANRGSLPAHLPRIEMVIDVPSTVCPCCSGAMHRIGEDVCERLDCKFARNSGSDALLMASQISGADDACLQQVDFAPTIHLAFNELQLGDLPLGLTIRPG
jgi:hypothetical protein